ncbi:transglycosylase SLT domain-containing protein [Gilvimarinus polysaccharolyticus]|uniref:transglycosylase SLT domain-containing protein n=1 Tax=Gilvimarinus polysaccharolyticus TaxID=863921 RepID=UPI000A05029D|nr:transglycosylase SLT domain-containing protein [Gilvimarinus polysaccharolyticus]
MQFLRSSLTLNAGALTTGRIAGIVTLAILLGCNHAHAATTSIAAPPSIADKTEQRKLYNQAQNAIRNGRNSEYQELLAELEHYPLKPYLEYNYINRRFSRLPAAEIAKFERDYPGSYLADKLNRRWVEKLAEKGKWADVVTQYRADNATTELTCFYLRGRVITGDSTAYNEVADIWSVGHSQPKACDPLFANWIKQGGVTDAIAWQRFIKAIDNRQRSLARYVTKLMSPETKQLANLYDEVDRNPRALRNMERFGKQSADMQQLILHGLQRLSLRDAELANDLWHRYDAQQLFADNARLETQRYIAVRLLRQGHTAETEALIKATPALSSEDLAEWLVRDALRNLDWHRVNKWIAMLPAEARATERWRYWQARALENTGGAPEQIKALYKQVAQTRSFYGFLSADQLNIPYELVDKPVVVPSVTRDEVALIGGVQRARELFILGKSLDARREWYHTTRELNEAQVFAAGKLAESWGWHRNGIQAMIQVRYWDDLELRFPLAYQEHVNTTAKDLSVAPHLLFAIARQESAFTADARSSAGALGLMQLLPSTAKQTAHRSGMSFSTYDLLEPATNIALGGRYLNQLLNQFDGNRILAAAAYNAGPNRVKKWLSKNSSLPYDVWIETIPYRETRGYVQNVLSYSVIYGYRLGEAKPFITASEAGSSL